MKKIIILEGHDNVGKSTFLKKYYSSFKVFPFDTKNIPKEQLRKHFWKKHLKFKEEIGKNNIIFADRSFIGEAVYGYLFRGYDIINEVKKEMDELNSKYDVLILTIISVGKNNYMIDKNDSQYSWAGLDNLAKVSNRFIEVIKQLKGIKRIILNADNYKNYNELQRAMFFVVDNFIKDKSVFYPFIDLKLYPYNHKEIAGNCPFCDECEVWKNQSTLNFKNPTRGLGYNTNYFIVGEAPGMKGCGYTGVVFYRDKSGMLLRQSLFELGYNLDIDFYTTNLIKCTPYKNKFPKNNEIKCKQFLIDEIKQYNPQKILCVSSRAYEFIKKQFSDKDIKKIYHPAFVFYKRGHRYLENVKYYKKILNESICS